MFHQADWAAVPQARMSEEEEANALRLKKQKCVILFAYLGAGYAVSTLLLTFAGAPTAARRSLVVCCTGNAVQSWPEDFGV